MYFALMMINEPTMNNISDSISEEVNDGNIDEMPKRILRKQLIKKKSTRL